MVLTCTWWTCSKEKSLLKQALNMGIDEDCAKSPVLPEGEPPPCSVLSRQSSVPFEAWLTESRTRSATTGTKAARHQLPLRRKRSDSCCLPAEELEVRACKMESA